MRGIKLVLLPLVVAGLSFGLAACGDDDEGDSGDGGGGETSLDMTIGVSLPLSGDLADFGPPGEKAADLALSEINAAIEEVGADHTIEAVKEDNCGAADPQCAVQAQRKLATSDGASCISGPWGSADVIPSCRIGVDPRGSPADHTIGDRGRDHRTRRRRLGQPDVAAGLVPGPDAVHVPCRRGAPGCRGQTVNIGARNDAYGTGLAQTFSDAWEEAGGEVGEEVIYDIDLPNYDTEADQIVRREPRRDHHHRLPGDLQQGRAPRWCGRDSIRRPRSSPTA